MTSEELRGVFEKETGFKIFTEPKGCDISLEYVLWLENRALLNAPENTSSNSDNAKCLESLKKELSRYPNRITFKQNEVLELFKKHFA